MIKFRVWSKTLGKYRQLDETSNDQGLGMLFEVKKGIGSNVTSICYSVGDIVEQFTGLTDVNGKEIYEGDVLEYYYETHGQTFYDPDTLGAVGGEPGIETNVIGKVVIWPSTGVVLTRIKAECPEDFDSSNLDVPKMLHVNKHFTIIGNVHENPELLE